MSIRIVVLPLLESNCIYLQVTFVKDESVCPSVKAERERDTFFEALSSPSEVGVTVYMGYCDDIQYFGVL